MIKEQLFEGELPMRRVEVYGLGMMEVVRHINRIDVLPTRLKPRQTHGWQVRYQRTSKYFGDGGESPLESLLRAEHHLRSIYSGSVSVLNEVESVNKRYKLDIPGVRVTQLKKSKYTLSNGERRDSNITLVYVESQNPFSGGKSQRFYVGTTNTATDEKMEECIRRAKEYRGKHVEAFKAYRAQVAVWSDKYTVENFMKFAQGYMAEAAKA